MLEVLLEGLIDNTKDLSTDALNFVRLPAKVNGVDATGAGLHSGFLVVSDTLGNITPLSSATQVANDVPTAIGLFFGPEPRGNEAKYQPGLYAAIVHWHTSLFDTNIYAKRNEADGANLTYAVGDLIYASPVWSVVTKDAAAATLIGVVEKLLTGTGLRIRKF